MIFPDGDFRRLHGEKLLQSVEIILSLDNGKEPFQQFVFRLHGKKKPARFMSKDYLGFLQASTPGRDENCWRQYEG